MTGSFEIVNMFDKVIFWSLCGILVLIPLPYGGVYEWTIFLFEAAVLILFAIHLAGRGTPEGKGGGSDEPGSPVPWKTPAFLWVLAAAFFVISVLQVIPLPLPLIRFLSPRTYELYANILQAGPPAAGGWRTLSLAPNLSVYELVKCACYALFTFLVYSYARSRRQIQALAAAMILSGVFQAVYGLFEYLGGTGRIFGWKNIHGMGVAFGTFVNRDHYAGFLEMTIALGLGYLLAKADFFSMKKGISLREKILWIGQEPLQKTFILWIGIAFMGIGIFASRSRSGVIIFFAIFLSMTALLISGAGRSAGGQPLVSGQRKKRWLRITGTLMLVAVIAAAVVGLNPILERFTKKWLRSSGRPEFSAVAGEITKNFPAAGTGPGTFVYAYQFFEKKSDGTLLRHAHNDYLEIPAESGIVGGAVLVALAFGALGVLFWKWLERRDSLPKGIGLGCMVGIIAILIHSVADFNLRIPSNAVYFLTLYALGMKAVMTKGKRHGED